MGIIQKQGLISTLFNYVGVGIAYMNLIFILPHFLSLEQIGLMRLIVEIAALLTLVFQFGSPYLIIRYFPNFNHSNTELRSFFTLAITNSILGIVLMLLFYFYFNNLIINYFSSNSALISRFQHSFLLIGGSMILFNVFERIFISRKTIILPTIIREIGLRFIVTITALLIGTHFLTFEQGLNFWVSVYLFFAILLLYMYKKKFGLKFTFSNKVWNKENYKEYLKYAALVSIGAIGAGLSIKIDMMMISSMIGLEEVGIYATMIYISTVIEIPKRGLSQISDPYISEYYSQGKIDKIGELYKKNSTVLLVFGLTIMLLIFSNINYLFEIMPKGEYFSIGLNVLYIISFVKISNLLSSISVQIILNSGNAWFTSPTVVTFAIISIVLNYLLIPRYGLTGAAIATFISTVSFNATTMIFVYVKFKLHPFNKGNLSVLFLTALFLLIIAFTPQISNPFLGILITSSIVGLSFLFVIWKLKISPEVNEMIFKMVKKIKGNS